MPISDVIAQLIRERAAEIQDDTIDAIKRFVRIDSQVGTPGEVQVQREFAEWLRTLALGLDVDVWTASLDDIKDQAGFSPLVNQDGTPSDTWKDKLCVCGTWTPTKGEDKVYTGRAATLILNGHLDIVPLGPERMWTSDPLEPRVSDDGKRLYGRGSGDMKAGVVSMVQALRLLRDLGYAPAARVHVQSVIEEECTGNGCLATVARGYRADAALIPEPFSSIMTGQMGVMWVRLVVDGRPAHVLDTSAGVNAIEAAYSFYEALRELETKWNVPEARHELFKDFKHPANFNLGRINGGQWASTVPSECTMDIRFGFYPGTDPMDALAEVRACLDAHATKMNYSYRLEQNGFRAAGCECDAKDGSLINTLAAAHERVTGEAAKREPVTCTTDARFFELYHDIPCTCLGPKWTRNIHGIDESVDLASVQALVATIAIFIAEWCGLEKIDA